MAVCGISESVVGAAVNNAVCGRVVDGCHMRVHIGDMEGTGHVDFRLYLVEEGLDRWWFISVGGRGGWSCRSLRGDVGMSRCW